MLMVVFGAGASYDSYAPAPAKRDPGLRWRPPLARELFSRPELYAQIDKFPEAGAIIPRLYALPGGISVEEELEKLQQQADDGDFDRARQLFAVRYYLQHVIMQCQNNWRTYTNNVSNYSMLLDQIRRWKADRPETICLVTFNYDSLLEEALWAMLRIPAPQKLDGYVSTDYKVFKPHGSVLWACEIDTRLPEIMEKVQAGDRWGIVRTVIKRAPELNTSDKYLVVSLEPISTEDRKVALLPAIAIPVQRKQHYECPEGHISLLDGLLPKVNRVAMIGWRGREEKFVAKMTRLLPKKVRTVVVSGDPGSTAEVRGHLQAAGYPGEIATATDGFSGFVLKEQLEQFLSWAGVDALRLD